MVVIFDFKHMNNKIWGKMILLQPLNIVVKAVFRLLF